MSLKVWLPLTGTLENKGILNDNFTINTTPTYVDNGKIGKAMALGSISMSAASMKDIFRNNTFSICFWLYVNADTGDTSKRAMFFGNNSPRRYSLFQYPSCNDLHWSWANDSSNNVSGVYSGAFPSYQWTHCAVTYDASKLSIYLNGARVYNNSVSYSPVNLDYNTVLFQNCANNGRYLNDYRIYDHCLSAAEVKEISQGLVLHYKLDAFNAGYGNPNLCKNSRTFGTGWGGTGAITQNTFNGFAVKYKDNTNGTGQTDIVSYSNVLTVNPSEIYTVSFWAKADIAHNVNCFFYNNTSGVVQCASSLASTGASGTSSDGNTSIALTTDWKYYWITWTFKSTGTAATKTLLLGRNAKGASGVSIAQVKLERGASATPWAPHPDDNEAITAMIQDSSGYEHNGIINNTLILNSNTARYDTSTYFNGTDATIKIPFNNCIKTDDYTVSVWTYKSVIGEKNYQTILGGPNGFELEARSGSSTNPVYRIHNWGGGTAAYELNKWNLFTFTRNATESKLYVNGELKVTGTAGSAPPSGNYFIGSWKNTTSQNYDGMMSDFRLYATVLSEADIKQLYELGAKVDNKGNLHTYEFNENGSNKLKKTGVFYNYATEPYMQLADGSCWKLMLFHYVDGGHNLFTSSNATYNDGFGLYSRLRDIDNFTYDNKYEFYVIQDGTEFRWTQTSKPTASSIAGLTTVSGYTNPVNGLAKASQSNTYIGYGSWWGACGCWTSYSVSGKTGIPGFGTHGAAGVCTTYLALYARIDQITYHNASNSHYANNLIEF